MLSALQTVSDT